MIPSIAVLVSTALAADDAESHLAQARVFIKQGYVKDAYNELLDAMLLPDGRANFEIAWLTSHVAFQLAHFDHALDFARLAGTASITSEQATLATQWIDQLQSGFGVVRITSPGRSTVVRLTLTPNDPILDPDVRVFADQQRRSGTRRHPLPAELVLPVGSWTVNGQTVLVRADAAADVVLDAEQLGADGLVSTERPRFDLGAGLAQPLGSWSATRATAPVGTLEFSVPLGPLRAAADVELGPQVTRVSGWLEHDWLGAVGVSAGWPVVLPGGLLFQGGLYGRAVRRPGVPVSCQGQDCNLDASSIDAVAVGSGFGAGGELRVGARHAGQSAANGLAVAVDWGGTWLDTPQAGTTPSGSDWQLQNASYASTELLLSARWSMFL